VITNGTITVDTVSLQSDSDRRDRIVQGQLLQTDQFPTITFVLDSPMSLPTPPARGSTIAVDLTGKLTVKGVTKPVTIAAKAVWDGTTVDLVGSAPVAVRDYGIEPPDSGFVKVDPNGSFEFQLRFAKG
jgi:polyisoprenoid-binding protein YceI